MSAADTLFTELVTYMQEIEATFLQIFLNDPLADPNKYKHFVKAYCVLSHAALEEYFEEIALAVMIHSISAWQTKRVFNDCLLALIGHHHRALHDPDEKRLRQSFDFLRHLLDEVKTQFSNEIHNNNGADIKYLKRLLEPVAINISNDPIQLNSLAKLANERGNYAHKSFAQGITSILSPSDAKTYVDDCLKLCEEVRNDANTKLV